MPMAARIFTRLLSIQAKLKTTPIENSFATSELRIRINDDFATVVYKKIDDTTYDLVHTYIPETYQGKGLGSIFAKRVFDHLVENNKKIKVTCEYLQKYVSKHKDKYKHNLLN